MLLGGYQEGLPDCTQTRFEDLLSFQLISSFHATHEALFSSEYITVTSSQS